MTEGYSNFFLNEFAESFFFSIQVICINFWLNFNCVNGSSKVGIIVSNANKNVKMIEL